MVRGMRTVQDPVSWLKRQEAREEKAIHGGNVGLVEAIGTSLADFAEENPAVEKREDEPETRQPERQEEVEDSQSVSDPEDEPLFEGNQPQNPVPLAVIHNEAGIGAVNKYEQLAENSDEDSSGDDDDQDSLFGDQSAKSGQKKETEMKESSKAPKDDEQAVESANSASSGKQETQQKELQIVDELKEPARLLAV